jgi:GNAT superfamily N-acetyltransferase
MSDMLVKLYDLPEKEPLLPALKNAGIEVRRAIPPEKHVVVEWVRTMFNPHWASECEAAFSRQPVSCYIATVPRPDAAGNNTHKMIGFACFDATNKGFFGPTGVDPEARGLGVGKELLLTALHAMRADGYAYGIIGSAGPTDFYAKLVGAIEIPGSSPGIYRGMLR